MRVGDPPARIYGVKIKLQEQQRRDELYRQSRYPRAKTCHSPFKQRSAWQVAKQCKQAKKRRTSAPSQIRKVGLVVRPCGVESPRVGV